MNVDETVKALMQQGKGILSAGEVSDVELERMKVYGIEGDDAHKAYRELLFTTPGIETHLTGVLLSEEAFSESSSGGMSFPQLLSSKKILPGVRMGTIDEVLPLFENGGEGFNKKIALLKTGGMTFASFVVRAEISDAALSDSVQKNIERAASAAKLALAAEIVPLIELDVSAEGLHTASQSEDMLVDLTALLSDALTKEAVAFPRVIVGVSMATAGTGNPAKAAADEVALRTVRAVTTSLSSELGGVVFLSDAETPEEGTENLNALARLEPLPWEIAFCFSRALHEPVLAAWKGQEENRAAAQAAFSERLSLLSRADWAGYSSKMETL